MRDVTKVEDHGFTSVAPNLESASGIFYSVNVRAFRDANYAPNKKYSARIGVGNSYPELESVSTMPKLNEIAGTIGSIKPAVFTRQGKRNRCRKPRSKPEPLTPD